MAKKTFSLKGFIIRTVLLLILLGLMAVGVIWWYLYDHYIHPGKMVITETPADYGLEFRRMELTSHDGLKLQAWLVKPPVQYRSDKMPTVVALHGYGVNRQEILDRIEHLARAGFMVFTYDHRGAGESEGSHVTLGVLELKDLLEQVVPAVMSLNMVDTENVAVYGYSMGGVLALNAAAREPRFKAVVSDGSYADLMLMTEKILGDRGLPTWPFVDLLRWSFKQNFGHDVDEIKVTDVVGQISPRPLLLLHGKADSTVPVSHANMIISAAREPKRLIVFEGHEHEDNGSPEIMINTVIPFLKDALEFRNELELEKSSSDEEITQGN